MLQTFGTDIVSDSTEFVSAYFSKVFSTELMQENQDIMSRREKFETLLKLYQYAKTRKLPKTLISNLLHETLALSLKLEEWSF